MRATYEKSLRSSSSFAALLAAFFFVAPVAAAVNSAIDDPMSNDLVDLRNKARAYEHGEGVPKDPVQAASLYCKGARLGDTEAQFSLGWMYANGRGLPRSDEVAAYFFKLASEKGHVQAKNMLRFVGDTGAATPECMRYSAADFDFDDVSKATNPSQQKVLGLVRKLAPEYGVSPRLVMAVIRNESNFQPSAVSPKNAQGLMQLIPETSARFNVKQPFDPEQNIRGGLSYLRWLLAYFEGNVALVVAAYNAGEGAVNRYKGIPPYAETRDYVKRIMSVVKNDEHPYDPAVTTPSPELPRIRLTKVL
ncbi:transglycosylase SLT domain-containing protein [Propionivibrio sp.]|uniref:transglycosylase SLT domain-containing protein n=1 Tax=Propionivibrio sp. TaxID=2212460 RepID=UPI003BF2A9BA